MVFFGAIPVHMRLIEEYKYSTHQPGTFNDLKH